MDVYSIIIDMRLIAKQLPRCLTALQKMMTRFPERLEVRIVSEDAAPELESLAERYGAHFVTIPIPSSGARNNEVVRGTSATVLIFPTSPMRFDPAWLGAAEYFLEQLLEDPHWDAALLTASQQHSALDLRRLWQRRPASSTLCIRRDWFERIGGFDPKLDREAHEDLIIRLRACQARILELPL